MLINGDPSSSLNASDRGLAYGEGLFETIRIHNSRLLFSDLHLQRLQEGCERLALPFPEHEILEDIKLLNAEFPIEGVLKIILTGGEGGRGYRSAEQSNPTRVLSLHPLPDYSQVLAKQGIATFLCKQSLALQPALAGIKHLNRLEQVLASQEWPDESFMEGIMLDTNGLVIEGTKSNVFISIEGQWLTPDLSSCGVEGIMRKVLLEQINKEGEKTVKIMECTLDLLREASEVLVCNSIFGIWPVKSLHIGEECWQYTPAELCETTTEIFDHFMNQLMSETT